MTENTAASLDLRYRDSDRIRIDDPALGREVEFYYELRGQGPQITVVNNFFLIAPMWRNFTQDLATRNRVLTYDLRNQGASSSGFDEVAWTDHVEDLRRVLDALGIERTYLVATSVSGLICRDFAAAYPERVRGLVLTGPALSPYGGRRRRAVTKAWLTTLERAGTEALFDHLYSMVFAEATLEAGGTAAYLGLREAFVALHGTDPVAANLRSSLQADDDPDLLRSIKCPTLLLVGENDFLWSATGLADAAELIPDCRSKLMPVAGHLPYLEATAEFEKAVQGFVDEIEALSLEAGRS